jgi:hypothetical protein
VIIDKLRVKRAKRSLQEASTSSDGDRPRTGTDAAEHRALNLTGSNDHAGHSAKRKSDIDMSVFKPRNRLVNFRLSEEEFDKLKALCPLHGARSISDFARSSVLERLDRQPDTAPPASMIPPSYAGHLDNKVNDLETRVDQLLNMLNAVGFTNAAEAPVSSPEAVRVRANSPERTNAE